MWLAFARSTKGSWSCSAIPEPGAELMLCRRGACVCVHMHMHAQKNALETTHLHILLAELLLLCQDESQPMPYHAPCGLTLFYVSPGDPSPSTQYCPGSGQRWLKMASGTGASPLHSLGCICFWLPQSSSVKFYCSSEVKCLGFAVLKSTFYRLVENLY